MPNPRERLDAQQRAERDARETMDKYATVVSDWSPLRETIESQQSRRFHPSEQAARYYAQDIFRRRKCDVQVLAPMNKGGAVLLDLRFDPVEEQAEREARAAESHEGSPAVVTAGAGEEDERAA